MICGNGIPTSSTDQRQSNLRDWIKAQLRQFSSVTESQFKSLIDEKFNRACCLHDDFFLWEFRRQFWYLARAVRNEARAFHKNFGARKGQVSIDTVDPPEADRISGEKLAIYRDNYAYIEAAVGSRFPEWGRNAYGRLVYMSQSKAEICRELDISKHSMSVFCDYLDQLYEQFMAD